MYLGIDVHKRHEQVAVMDEAGELVENRTNYANKVHGLLSDHGITQDIKPLSVSGRESLRDLSLPTLWDSCWSHISK